MGRGIGIGMTNIRMRVVMGVISDEKEMAGSRFMLGNQVMAVAPSIERMGDHLVRADRDMEAVNLLGVGWMRGCLMDDITGRVRLMDDDYDDEDNDHERRGRNEKIILEI